MKMRRWLSALLLAALLMALPADALAAKKPTIKMPVKVGLMLEGGTVTVKPKVKRVKASELIWESSDESVALAAEGKIKALAAGMLKILQARLQQYVNHELPDVQAGFRKGRGTRDQMPTSVGSSKKQESSRKTFISALLTMPKPLTMWITTTTNFGKF